MQGLLTLLLYAAFFYFMMRFGCGAHMVHGHHGGHEDHGATGGTKDPVCGMEVQSGQGYAKVHEGREYRFCSRQCLDKFELEPQRYAKGGAR